MNATNMHESDEQNPGDCPVCGKPLPSDAPLGICPACLLNVDLNDGNSGFQGVSNSGTNNRADGKPTFVPPAPRDLTRVFPNLEIQEVIGFGGMGAVYRARQINLDRLVALKIIRPDAIHHTGFAERFSREARALAKLNHQNIVGIHDFGEIDNNFYLVMEFVDGVTLRQLIVDQQLLSGQALPIVQQICEALQFAHDEGVVHRDIKPENILIDTRGRVKIADFGLAKLLSDSGKDMTLTGTHQMMGTPRYMAPEQMEGARQVDHRADIYSLGVVFYEMLTGELPLGQFEPPSRKAHVDQRLDQVVMRSLAREPERRYQRASDVKTDVDSICQSNEGHTTKASPYESPLDPAPVTAPPAQVGRKPALSNETNAHAPHPIANARPVKRRQTYAFNAMMALCFVAAATLFFSWGQIHVEGKPVAANGQVLPGSETVETVIYVSAYRYYFPFAASILGLMAGFACLATQSSRSIYAAVVASSAGIVLTLSSFIVLVATPITEHDADFRSFARNLNYTLGSSAIEAFTELHSLDRITITCTPTFMCFGALFIGVALLAASVLFGQSKLEESTEPGSISNEGLLNHAASALKMAGWTSILLLSLLFVLMLIGHVILNYEQFGALTHYFLTPAILSQIAAILLFTPLTLISAKRLRNGLSPRLAWYCAIIAMLPLSPAFIFGLPLGAIVLWTLSQSRVKREMQNRTVNPVLGKAQVQTAGKALWVAGVLQLVIALALVVGAIVALGKFSPPMGQLVRIRKDVDEAQLLLALQSISSTHSDSSTGVRFGKEHFAIYSCCLLVFIHALPMLLGGNALRQLRPTRWRLATVAAFIPLTPIWFLSMPVGVYLLAIFRQTVDSKTGEMEDLLDGNPPAR